MNKLRAFASLAGGLLFALSIWAWVRYGGVRTISPYLATAGLGAVMAALPALLAHAKHRGREAYRRLRTADSEKTHGESLFVSEASVGDPSAVLDEIAADLRADEEYGDVRRNAFSEGTGLTVGLSGTHSSSVRVTESGHLAVIGASERTRSLARRIEASTAVSFEPTVSNPFKKPEPVKGAPRVFLGLALIGLLAVGGGGVANAAYPSDAYTPTEKVVLVSFDVKADLDPGTTDTDARLGKARFMVRVIDEEAVEIRWERNVTNRVRRHGQQAVRIGDDVRTLLETVRRADVTARQAATADRITVDLREAERNVADALADKATHDAVRGDELLRLRQRLRAPENATLES